MMKLSFEMALANMKRGEMVRRACFPYTAYRIKDGWFAVYMLTINGNGDGVWESIGMDGYVLAEDVMAEDWMVVE